MLSQKQQKMRPVPSGSNDRLKKAKRKVLAQAMVVLFVILVTVVLLFAMTTAWYTNVVQTQGLTFQAETWGFDGEVVLSEEGILAMPGDEGIIAMSITNNSEQASALTVNISKQYLLQELQPRIYFYADETVLINEEQVQRQYLSNNEGYTYTLGGKGTLVLSDDVCTDVPLKWHWVYDLAGYYFTGRTSGDVVTLQEYLRPVEYSFDDAIFDEEENLTGLDEDTPVEVFLAQLTQTDGYPGAFYAETDDEGEVTAFKDQDGNDVEKYLDKYYCIQEETDEEAGVYLYLCSKTEIENNTQWDTQFVLKELEERSFSVRMSITGTQIWKETTVLTDPAQLESVLNASSGGIVQLQQSITLADTVTLEDGADVVLDLNGHTVTYDGNEPAFAVTTGNTLTLMNGSVNGPTNGSGNGEIVNSVGGHVTLSNVSMEDVFVAVRIEDYLTEDEHGANSVVRIVDCDLKSKDDTVQICGDGLASAGKTLLLIQNSNLESETYVGILGKGNDVNPSQWGTDIQISDSTITGFYAGIYHPMQESTLSISNSTVSGMTGIALKGGELTVIDSKIEGTGTDGVVVDPEKATLTGSGWLDTGDGIYVESDYEYPVKVTVSGECEITCLATTAKAVRVYPQADHVRIRVEGGTFTSSVEAFLAEGYVQTTENGAFVVKAAE